VSWGSETSHGLQLTRMGPRCGVEVAGISLREPTVECIATLTELLNRHKVVVVRAANLTVAEHVDLARRFGTVELHPYLANLRSPQPDVLVMEGSRALADIFHSDETFLAAPPSICLLRIEAVPGSGGDTQWINLEAAYDSLDAAAQHALHKADAIHQTLDGDRTARHPAVRFHPRTGRPALFINRLYTKAIDGPTGSSVPELASLLDQSEDPALGCQVQWDVGDFAIWDNCCSVHRVNNDFDSFRRVERVAVAAAEPLRFGG